MSNETIESNVVTDDLLPIVPVRNLVVFPGAVTHVAIGRDISVRAAELAVKEERK